MSIAPASPLPAITSPVVLDATTQPGFTAAPIVELNGVGAGAAANGIVVTAGSTTIRGLAINRFGGNGIVLQGPGGGSAVEGNYIGTDATGALDRGNGLAGILVLNSGANLIGGTVAAQRNVLSGNDGNGINVVGSSSVNTIAGNYIGTNAAGTTALGNGLYGVFLGGSASSVQSTFIGRGNVIAANGRRRAHQRRWNDLHSSPGT